MNFFYGILAISLVFISLNRSFDFLTAGALFLVLYTSSCFSGKAWVTGVGGIEIYSANISNTAYILIMLQLVIYIVLLFIFDELNKKSSRSKALHGVNEQKQVEPSQAAVSFWNLMLAVTMVIFAYTILFEMGLSNFFSYARKGDLTEDIGPFFSLTQWLSVACFLNAVKVGNGKNAIVAIIPLLLTLLLGSRSYVVIAGIGAALIVSSKYGYLRKIKARYVALGIVALMFMLLYKEVYQSVRALDFAAIARTLSDPSLINRMFDIEEFRINGALFNRIVETDFSIPIQDSLARIFSFVPFVSDAFTLEYPLRLSQYLQFNMFGTSYGLGGSFWGEAIAMGGVPFFFLIYVSWLQLLNWGGRWLRSNSEMAVLPITFLVYASFYIFRLDWQQVAGCFKNMLLLYLFWIFWKWIWGAKHHQSALEKTNDRFEVPTSLQGNK